MSLTSPALVGRLFTTSATWEAHVNLSYVTYRLEHTCLEEGQVVGKWELTFRGPEYRGGHAVGKGVF